MLPLLALGLFIFVLNKSSHVLFFPAADHSNSISSQIMCVISMCCSFTFVITFIYLFIKIARAGGKRIRD